MNNHVFCPSCKEGSRFLYRLSDQNNSIILICEECNSVWINPENIGFGYTASDEKLVDMFNVQNSEALFDSSSDWASYDQAVQSRWNDYINIALFIHNHQTL